MGIPGTKSKSKSKRKRQGGGRLAWDSLWVCVYIILVSIILVSITLNSGGHKSIVGVTTHILGGGGGGGCQLLEYPGVVVLSGVIWIGMLC